MKPKRVPTGGAWKVAYADFFTAMMALFLVLWLTAQDTRIKEAVERAFRNPFSAVNKESTGIIPNRNRDASSASRHLPQGKFNSNSPLEVQMLRHITEDLAKLLDNVDETQRPVQLDITPDGLRIQVFDRAQKPTFKSDSDDLTSYGDWVFSTLAWEISRYQTFKIELEGHTCASPDQGRERDSKWELSSERANAARRKLLENGVVSSQFFKVSGLADTQPIENVPASEEMNRRVTILLRIQNPDQPIFASSR
jgi:chemotaxis protein MotB